MASQMMGLTDKRKKWMDLGSFPFYGLKGDFIWSELPIQTVSWRVFLFP